MQLGDAGLTRGDTYKATSCRIQRQIHVEDKRNIELFSEKLEKKT